MKENNFELINKIATIVFPILLISITATFFYALLFNAQIPLLSGEDSYYHLGMAKFIKEAGIVHKFPYLFFTTLHDSFVDHHLLFHLALMLFIKLFGDILGAKLLIILSLALLYFFLYQIFRLSNLKYAFFYSLVALFTMPSDFYFRMTFIRVQAPALLFMVLIFWAIKKSNYLILGIISFLFPWLYGGSVFLPVIVGCYIVVSYLKEEKPNWKIVQVCLLGFVLGVVVNPYFPKNLYFLYDQIFKTGLNAKSYSGGEWRPYDTWFWVQVSFIPIVLLFGSIIFAMSKNLKVNTYKLTVLLFTFFMLFLQWKSKRFVEYWPLFAEMSAFLIIGPYIEKINKKNYYIRPVALILTVLLILPIASKQINMAIEDIKTPAHINDTEKAMAYLKENSSPGDIIFTDDWDIFPYYFYFNRKNYYIVGLDPEFMNQYNQKLYQDYSNISSGKDSAKLDKIKTTFKANWVIVDSYHPVFNHNLEERGDLFTKVYQNSNYTVYKVK